MAKVSWTLYDPTLSNLLANAGLETNWDGLSPGGTPGTWSSANTAVVDNTHSFTGSNAVKVTSNGTDVRLLYNTLTLAAGSTYQFSAWIYLSAGWDGGAVRIDSEGFGAEVFSTSAVTGAFVRINSRITPTSPGSGFTYFMIRSTTPATKAMWVDAVMVELGATLDPYTTVGSTSFTFPINPSPDKPQAEPNYQKQLGSSLSAPNVAQGATGTLAPVISQIQDTVLTSQFAGEILTQAHYTAMWTWCSKTNLLLLTDDLGRTQSIYIVDFYPKRVRSPDFPWRHQYTVKFLALIPQIGDV